MTITINQSFKTKLKAVAITRKSTLRDTFDYALDLLFNEYKAVLTGKEETITLPTIATKNRKTEIIVDIDEDKEEKLDRLSKKTGFSKSVFCNIAIYLLLEEEGLV